MPQLRACADVVVQDMFISVNRCEVGAQGKTTAVMEVKEEFGIDVHAIVTVQDIYEYLERQGGYTDVLSRMAAYMQAYCRL